MTRVDGRQAQALIPGQGFDRIEENAHAAGKIGDIASDDAITSQVPDEHDISPASERRDGLHRRATDRLRRRVGSGPDGGAAWSAASSVGSVGQAASDPETLWSPIASPERRFPSCPTRQTRQPPTE